MAEYVIVSGPGAAIGEGLFWSPDKTSTYWSPSVDDARKYSNPDTAVRTISGVIAVVNDPRIRRVEKGSEYRTTSIEEALKKGLPFVIQSKWHDRDDGFLSPSNETTSLINAARYTTLEHAIERLRIVSYEDGVDSVGYIVRVLTIHGVELVSTTRLVELA